jgi:hypothetical protein
MELNGGINPIIITRVAMMKAAKINARCTYNKCMNNLQKFGYITYLPSSNMEKSYMLSIPGMGPVIPSSSTILQLELNAEAGKTKLSEDQNSIS